MGIGIMAWRAIIGSFSSPISWKVVSLGDVYTPHTRWTPMNDFLYRTICSLFVCAITIGGGYALVGSLNLFNLFLESTGRIDYSIETIVANTTLPLNLNPLESRRSYVTNSLNIVLEVTLKMQMNLTFQINTPAQPVHQPHIACLLQCAGDVELNPGPEHDIIKAMQAMKDDLFVEINRNGREIRQELLEMKQTQEAIQTKCSRLDSRVSNMEAVVTKLKDEVRDTTEHHNVEDLDCSAINEKLDEILGRLDILDEDADRQESFSRRDNVRLYGITEDTGETFDLCKEKIINLLNENVKDKVWVKRDIVRAHRVPGVAVQGRIRPIIVKFHHSDDKLLALSARPTLKENGIGIGNDLTRRQRETLAKLKSNGQKGYYKKGKLFILPNTDEIQHQSQHHEEGRQSVPPRPRTRLQHRQQIDNSSVIDAE